LVAGLSPEPGAASDPKLSARMKRFRIAVGDSDLVID
jgi:hypothetical protein